MFDRIYIEISNICNLQCSFCPEVLRPKKLMNPNQFQTIIRDVKPYTRAITLHVMGEPLAHPQFPDFIKIIHEESVPLILTSNGILLNRHRNLLLKPSINSNNQIKQINFSVHSFYDNFPGKDIRIYLRTLVEFAKDFVLNNQESFINFRLWNLSNTTSLLEPHNKPIYAVFKEMFQNPELPNELDVKSKKSFRLDRHIKMHFDTQFEWPSLKSTASPSDGFCYGLKNQLAILTEGTVVPCCLDKEAIINLGSIFDSSLETILNSKRAQNIVNGFNNNIAIEELCKKCQFKQRFPKH